MSAPSIVSSSFVAQSSEFIGLAALSRVLAARAKRRQQRKALRDLAALADRDLADIGLNRSDIRMRVSITGLGQ